MSTSGSAGRSGTPPRQTPLYLLERITNDVHALECLLYKLDTQQASSLHPRLSDQLGDLRQRLPDHESSLREVERMESEKEFPYNVEEATHNTIDRFIDVVKILAQRLVRSKEIWKHFRSSLMMAQMLGLLLESLSKTWLKNRRLLDPRSRISKKSLRLLTRVKTRISLRTNLPRIPKHSCTMRFCVSSRRLWRSRSA